jgi:glycosyltransferase involved in cell wall biosynthesis
VSDVSIIICTRNRVESLRETLRSLANVNVPADGGEVELLIVDNGSSDHTDQVSRSVPMPLISVRYIREARVGQCFARNTGVSAARGKVIVFTDDDIRFPADWIAGISRPILSGEADAVGGGIKLAPHLNRPWITDAHRWRLASTQGLSDASKPALIGANFAFGRHVLDRVPAFDTELGPGALGFGDETLFSWQLAAAGYRIVAAPASAAVEHHFDPSRLSRKSLLAVADKQARSSAYLNYHWNHQSEPNLSRRIARAALGLAVFRLRNWIACRAAEGGPPRELDYVSRLAGLRQMRIEQCRARNYDLHGLIKRSSAGAKAAAAVSVPSLAGEAR